MTLNAYLAIFVAVLVLLSPLFLITAPVWLVWCLFQKRRQRALGLRTIWPFMATTAEHYARLMIRGEAPGGDWRNVSRNLDAYIADTRSPRIWRLKLMMIILEIAPLLRLRPTFTMMSDESRLAFIENNLRHGRGLMRIVSLGRQLMRLCYYATQATHQRMGFVPMAKRTAWRAASEKKELVEV